MNLNTILGCRYRIGWSFQSRLLAKGEAAHYGRCCSLPQRERVADDAACSLRQTLLTAANAAHNRRGSKLPMTLLTTADAAHCCERC